MNSGPDDVRVLLVEDSAMEAELLGDVLALARRPRFAVRRAVTLADALVKLAEAPPDVVILDLGLPDSTGLDGLRRVVEADPAVAVIVRTGLSDERVAVQALADGAQDYLFKGAPLDDDVINRSILFALARHRSEQAARRLAAIVDASDDAIFGLALDGTITSWNPGAQRVYGYAAADAIGEAALMLCVLPGGEAPFAQLLERLSGGETIETIETVHRRADGVAIDVAITLSPVLGPGSRPVGVAVVARDVSATKRAEREHRRGLAEMREAQRIARVGSFTLDVAANEGTWSEEMYRLTARDPALGPGDYEEWLAYVHPDDRARGRAAIPGILAGDDHEIDYRVIAGDGTDRILHVIARRDPSRPGRIVGTLQDVTALRAAERALRGSRTELVAQRELLAGVLNHAPIGMALVEPPRGRFIRVNRALCELVGYTEPELLTRGIVEITHPDEVAAGLAGIDQLLAGELDTYRAETRYLHRDGRVISVALSVSLISDDAGRPLHFVAQFADTSERRRYEAELERLATHDALTGLANHRLFHQRLHEALAHAIRHERDLSVVVLDLDHFKQINDAHGHVVGDHALVAVAMRLRSVVREGELLARVGGEEFAWILPDADGAGAYAAAERAREAVCGEPLPPVGTLTLSAGVGCRDELTEATVVYERADQALYDAKRAGRNRTVRWGAVVR